MSTMDFSALYDEEATQEEVVACYQALINNGMAWRLEGHVGRTAMTLIESGHCVLGIEDFRDYYGNHIPSRTQVQEGSKGSVTYAQERTGWTEECDT